MQLHSNSHAIIPISKPARQVFFCVTERLSGIGAAWIYSRIFAFPRKNLTGLRKRRFMSCFPSKNRRREVKVEVEIHFDHPERFYGRRLTNSHLTFVVEPKKKRYLRLVSLDFSWLASAYSRQSRRKVIFRTAAANLHSSGATRTFELTHRCPIKFN